MHWQIKLSIPDRSMLILIINWVHWNIVLYVLKQKLLDKPNFQGNAAVNYTDRETPWTRIIEHKWFEFGKDENGNDLPKTVISREYSSVSGNQVMNLIILLMMKRMEHCMQNIRSLQIKRKRSFLVVVWVNISTMIWIR